MQNGLIKLLAIDNYIIYNKTLAKKIGVENTILLGTLCSLQNNFNQDEFYREEEKLSEDTCLSIYTLRKCKKELSQLGVVEIVKKDLPARHYFKINIEKIMELLSSDENESTSSTKNTTTSGDEFYTTGGNEFDTANINSINNSINNIKENYNKRNVESSFESDSDEELFNKFWKEYPKKVSKEKAKKWFIKNKPSEELVNLMIKQLKRFKTLKQWKDKDGQYIPYPSSWLNAHSWEDEFETDEEKIDRIFDKLED